MDTSEQIELLEEFGVDYVIGLAEITPAPPGGERIYSEDGYVIFKVR
jgi:hypothetical protein